MDDIIESKRCGKCGQVKPVSEFNKRSRKMKLTEERRRQDPIRYAHYKERRRRYPHKPHRTKRSNRYLMLLEQQGGVCAICGQPETSKDQFGKVRSLALDHNHQTGHVRGLLCFRCNVDLASLEDETFVNAAKTYLARYAK